MRRPPPRLALLLLASGSSATTEWRIAVLPDGRPFAPTDFALAPSPPLDAAALKQGEALFALEYASVDAATRIWTDGGGSAQGWGFFSKLQKRPGDAMFTFGAVLRCLASRHPDWAAGELGVGASAIRAVQVLDPAAARLRKALGSVDPSLELSVLGTTTGLTGEDTRLREAAPRSALRPDAAPSPPSPAAQRCSPSRSCCRPSQRGRAWCMCRPRRAGSGCWRRSSSSCATRRASSARLGRTRRRGGRAAGRRPREREERERGGSSCWQVRLLRSKYGIEAFNYRRQAVGDALAAFAPEGVDVFFDGGRPFPRAAPERGSTDAPPPLSRPAAAHRPPPAARVTASAAAATGVGGRTLDEALLHMSKFGTVLNVGAVSEFSSSSRGGLANAHAITDRALRISGFGVANYVPDFADARRRRAAPAPAPSPCLLCPYRHSLAGAGSPTSSSPASSRPRRPSLGGRSTAQRTPRSTPAAASARCSSPAPSPRRRGEEERTEAEEGAEGRRPWRSWWCGQALRSGATRRPSPTPSCTTTGSTRSPRCEPSPSRT